MLYMPLRQAEEIRLLKLYGRVNTAKASSVRQWDDLTIACELYSIGFDAAKEQGYHTLSYTWGTDSDLCSISVNGLEVMVTRNLSLALLNLREENDITLWVDAICINQKDYSEKNHQVAFMSNIYAHAQTTKVWLGLSDHTSAATVAKITDIGRRIKSSGNTAQFQLLAFQKCIGEHFVEDREGKIEELVDDMFQEASLDPEESIQFLKSLHSILSRPYWSRVW